MSVFSRLRKDRGAVLPMIAVWLIGLMAVSALAVDTGLMYTRKQRLQNVADAAALAGAGALREGSMNFDTVKAAIVASVAANAAVGEPIALDTTQQAGTGKYTDIQFGVWNSATKSLGPWDPNAEEFAVQVNVRRTNGSPSGAVPTVLAGILGHPTVNITASATAGIFVNTTPRPPVQFIVVQDMSGSFVEEWQQAVAADRALLDLINGVSIDHDGAGLIGFNDDIKQTTYPQNHDRTAGDPRKTDASGVTDTKKGKVRQVSSDLSNFDKTNHTNLTTPMQTGISLLSNDNTGGNTNPAPAIDWATQQFDTAGYSGSNHVIVLVSDGMPNPSSNRQRAIDAANRAAAKNIRIHTITLTNEPTGGNYGTTGSDYEFNKSLVRNGGIALQTSDPDKLKELIVAVGSKELGPPTLLK